MARSALALVGIVAGAAGCLRVQRVRPATPTFTPVPAARVAAVLDTAFPEAIRREVVTGLAVGLVLDGRLAYARGFGVARLGDTASLGPRSVFHMASVTKPFVATSVLQLAERGAVDLDAPVVRYVPYFRLRDPRFAEITVRQMLSHSSGTPDVSNYEWETPSYDARALERFVRSVADSTLAFPPGARWQYSNTAYEVLGHLIERVSGELFEEYVERHILAPLGMRESTLLMGIPPRYFVTGHLRRGDTLVVSRVYPYNRAHAPSSTLHSNVVDMSRWAIANLNRGTLDGRRILHDSTYDLLWRPHVRAYTASDSLAVHVGLSWFIKAAGPATPRLVFHSGADRGFTSCLILVPERRAAAVVMLNRGGAPPCGHALAALKAGGIVPRDYVL